MSRHLSPTAQLLRSSRLFSLPQPLPKPVIENQVGLGYRTSDTATNPFPTHQAIAAPESSIRRGDWGFKRPLPVRDTSNEIKPFVRTVARLTGLDTIEHITDYETASDLEKTWEKFQEMRIALVRTDIKKAVGTPENKSAFEPLYDHTDKKTAPSLGPHADGKSTRWKHTGPSLGEMTQRDFDNFIKKDLHNQRKDFDQIVKAEVLGIYLRNRREEAQKALQEGEKIVEHLPNEHVTEVGEQAVVNIPEDAASRVNLEYMNWLCQLPTAARSASPKKNGTHGTWKHYAMHMQQYGEGTKKVFCGRDEDGKLIFVERLGYLSYLDELSALHGHENVKENLLQKLRDLNDRDYQKTLLQPDREEKLSSAPGEQKEEWVQRQVRNVYLSNISSALSITVPRVSYLGTTMEELHALPREDSMGRIVNVLIAEWKFLTEFKWRFKKSCLRWLAKRRNDITDTSELNGKIRDFLDLAPITAEELSGKSEKAASAKFSTHPSAGLSYLKTNSYFDNHPILGPQSMRGTFDARVLSPRSNSSRTGTAHLGIGGFVVQEPRGTSGHAKDADAKLANVHPMFEAEGGLKLPMEVSSASISRFAAVKLQIQRPTTTDTARIKQGFLEHALEETYKTSRRAEPFPDRLNARLDAGGAPSEGKTQGDSIVRLMKLLDAKQQDREA